MAYTTINKSSDYFNTKLYTGTGATHNVTGVDFQPDFVWINNRTGTYATTIFDAVRDATKFLEPAGTSAEQTYADTLTSFDSDGFTLGADTSSFCNRGSAPNSYVAWNWLGANGTASNTDGTATSTVSANTTSGFSIVSYTGTGATGTIGHGLGVAPKFMIIKNRTDATNWNVYTTVIDGSMDYLYLNLTDAKGDSSASVPTSSVLNLTTSNDVNGSGDDMIAYCFAEKKGFSKFGSYTGNGSTDGTFVYTGFKPAWVMAKRTDSADWWGMFDNKRLGYNELNYMLFSNTNDAEASTVPIDLLSNGFKIRNSNGGLNASGGSYIYMCFAESPLVGTNNIPATAR